MVTPATTLQKFDLYHALWKSFYSQEFYHDVAFQWQGTCIGYLFILICLAFGVFCIQLQFSWQMFLQTDVAPLLTQLPVMQIEGGKISTRQPGRYEIHDIATQRMVAVIDTSSPDLPKDDKDATVLISQDKIHLDNSLPGVFLRIFSMILLEEKASIVESPDYSATMTPQPGLKLTMDHAYAETWLNNFQQALIPAAMPFIFTWYLFSRGLLALLLSLTARNFQRNMGMTLDYITVLRITIIAMTPAILLEVTLCALAVDDPLLSVLLLIIMVLSVAMAFISIREPLKTDDDNDTDADIF